MKGHTICWTDIPVRDLDRATKFYSAILGAAVSKQSEGDYQFALLPHDENVSGCLYVAQDNEPSMMGPLVYFSVEGRLDRAAEAAQANGGKILQKKEQIGPHGFRVIIADTEGNRIALHSGVA